MPKPHPLIYIIIATAFERTRLLLERSLLSVYTQQGVDGNSIRVVVVDDNVNQNEISKIKTGIAQLREALGLDAHTFSTEVIPNQRTRFKSGTGAWNTGIFFALAEDSDSFVAILDDDDEFLPGHMATCLDQNLFTWGIRVSREAICSLNLQP